MSLHNNKWAHELICFPGMRMGKMQTKVGLVLMMQKFKYKLAPNIANREMEFDPKLFLLSPCFGVNLIVNKR